MFVCLAIFVIFDFWGFLLLIISKHESYKEETTSTFTVNAEEDESHKEDEQIQASASPTEVHIPAELISGTSNIERQSKKSRAAAGKRVSRLTEIGLPKQSELPALEEAPLAQERVVLQQVAMHGPDELDGIEDFFAL